MDFGKALLETGKFAFKATAFIAEAVLDMTAQKVNSAYKEGKIERNKYDEYKETTNKLSQEIDSIKNIDYKKDKKN